MPVNFGMKEELTDPSNILLLKAISCMNLSSYTLRQTHVILTGMPLVSSVNE